MIPTLQILTERVQRILNKGDIQRDRVFDPRDIEYLLRDECAKLMKGNWFEVRNAGEKNISSIYVTTFICPVLEDEAGNNYSDVPVSNYLLLPDESGIQSVRPDVLTTSTRKSKESELLGFIPVPNRYRDIYAMLPAGALEGQFSYQVRKNKVFFGLRYNQTVLFNGIENVEMDIATVAPEAVAITDPLPIPAEMVVDLMMGVLQILGLTQKQAKDLTDNENPNK